MLIFDQDYRIQGNKIIFTRRFNKRIDKDHEFLKKFNSIDFEHGSYFNQQLDNLPSNIQVIKLYDRFNQPLNNLPNTLKSLCVYGEYSYPLENLPDSLVKLSLIKGDYFGLLDNLPSSLKSLHIHFSDVKTDKKNYLHNLPNSIVNLVLYSDSRASNFSFYIPDSVINLEITNYVYNCLDNFPSSLKYLTIIDFENDVINFPEGLEILHLKNEFFGLIINLPSTLKKIIISDSSYEFKPEYEILYPDVIFSYDE